MHGQNNIKYKNSYKINFHHTNRGQLYEILFTCPSDKIIKLFCSKWYPVSGQEVNKLGRRTVPYNTRRSTTRRKAMMKAVNPSHLRISTFPMSWNPYRSYRQMQTLLAPRRETTKVHSHTTDPVVACYGHAKHARRRQSQWTAEKQLRWEKGEDYARYTLSPIRITVTLRSALFWDITQRIAVIPSKLRADWS